MEQTIELDCAPMTPRPDTYIGGVIEGTGLEVKEPIVGQLVSVTGLGTIVKSLKKSGKQSNLH